MRIVYLGAGAGRMYCGSCLHDNTLAAALKEAGEDVLLIPTYTPIRTDEDNVSESCVLFGGINVYLQQKWSLFRHTPSMFEYVLDRPWLIDKVTQLGISTDATKLGPLAVSMLNGESGNQRKELRKLVHWLDRMAKPDVVHLSNSMLVGMAGEIRRRLNVPVVCTLSGEDIFLEKLPQPWYDRARELLQRRAADITAFVAMNRYYADFMSDYLSVPRDRIHVIPHGLKLDGHGTRQPRQGGREYTIGFLARICEDKGLHLLVDAFIRLASDDTLPPVRLKVAGYLAKQDRSYLSTLIDRIHSAGLASRFEYVGELDRANKIAFLQSLDVMSVPSVYQESKGISILEAWANAVPVVVPAHGTFPELIADTNGGLLHEPLNSESLADAIRSMIMDSEMANECGRRAQEAIHARYTDRLMALRTLELYRQLLEKRVH